MRARKRSGAVAVAVTSLVAGLTTAGSAPHSLAANASPFAAVGAARVASPFPADDPIYSATAGLATTAYVGRARLTIDIPPFYGLVWIIPADRPADFGPAPSFVRSQRPRPDCDYYLKYFTNDVYVTKIDQPDASQPGRAYDVGPLPDARVAFLAFGSIPVTATLHLRQPVRNGLVEPLSADIDDGRTSVPRGQPVTTATPGCDAPWEKGPASPPNVAFVRGRLLVGVSDITVDGRRLDVGPRCRTVSALQLDARSLPGYDVTNGGGIVQRRDTSSVIKAGNTYPLYPESKNLTIPPFEGCRDTSSGEDYSRLLSGLVSGPGATVALTQSAVRFNQQPRQPVPCDGPTGCLVLPANPRPVPPGR